MKRIIFSVILLFLAACASVPTGTKTESPKARFVFLHKNGLYGLLDENGNEMAPAKYTQIEVLGNNRIALFAKDGIRLINEKGRIIGSTFYEIGSFNPVDSADPDAGMLAPASLGPNEYGFIDESGIFKIAPIFEGVRSFYNGFAPVKISGKWGLIDKNGKVALNAIYDSIWIMQNGLLIVTDEKTSKKCVIKTDGTEIFSCEYDKIQAFNKLLHAYKKDEDKSRIFDLDGKLLFETEGSGTLWDLQEGMTSFETKEETLIFDTSNKIVMRGNFSLNFGAHFYKGRIEVETPEKQEKYFDITGKWFSFEEFLISDFSEGEKFRIHHRHGKSGLIDRKGIYILKPEYDWNELEKIKTDTFLIRKNGFFIFSPPSEPRKIKDVDNVIYSGYEDLLFFEKSEKTGFMTSSGKIVVPAKYDEITGYNIFMDKEPSNLLIVRNGKLYGVIDKAGKEIFPIEFDYIDYFYDGEAIASKNGKYMVLEESGKVKFVSEYPIKYLVKKVIQEFPPKKERWIP